MAKMADGFAMVDRGARVIAVLSPHYLKKEYCLAEAQYPLTGDPSNRQERLIVLRVSDCAPTGFLKGIPYVDLVPLLLDAEGFARAVRSAVAPRGRGGGRADAGRAGSACGGPGCAGLHRPRGGVGGGGGGAVEEGRQGGADQRRRHWPTCRRLLSHAMAILISTGWP